ncbi:hypothetical protein H3H32_18400 [Spirosoma foliorum]|uniref:Uncharacterized protein n=1 Tax=Spirosoma foliorum TaxID=2710596 RepID=A0A7G5H7A8_9BACT|nr:hypothetical protein H3H32_18400 [Spirosoma foliorum]
MIPTLMRKEPEPIRKVVIGDLPMKTRF